MRINGKIILLRFKKRKIPWNWTVYKNVKFIHQNSQKWKNYLAKVYYLRENILWNCTLNSNVKFTLIKMAKNGPNWSKMAQIDLKWQKIILLNFIRKIHQNCIVYTVHKCEIHSHQNGQKWHKMAKLPCWGSLMPVDSMTMASMSPVTESLVNSIKRSSLKAQQMQPLCISTIASSFWMSFVFWIRAASMFSAAISLTKTATFSPKSKNIFFKNGPKWVKLIKNDQKIWCLFSWSQFRIEFICKNRLISRKIRVAET